MAATRTSKIKANLRQSTLKWNSVYKIMRMWRSASSTSTKPSQQASYPTQRVPTPCTWSERVTNSLLKLPTGGCMRTGLIMSSKISACKIRTGTWWSRVIWAGSRLFRPWNWTLPIFVWSISIGIKRLRGRKDKFWGFWPKSNRKRSSPWFRLCWSSGKLNTKDPKKRNSRIKGGASNWLM